MSQSSTLTLDSPVVALCDNASSAPASTSRGCRVAYLMSRFPKLTETFVLYEILAVEKQGAQVEIFPLLGKPPSGKGVAGAGLLQKLRDYLADPTQPNVMHAEAEAYVSKARYMPFVSREIALANAITFLRQPIRYLTTILQLIRWNFGNKNFLLGGLAIFPKCVAFARQIEGECIDHIHAHFANHPAMAAYVVHRFTNIPYSFTAHGSDLHRFKHMLREKVQHAAFVVTISSYNRDRIIDHCGQQYAEKTHKLHCGVDLDEFQPPHSRKERSECLQIICVGTLHEVKGQAYLIKALGVLLRQGIPAHIHFVGDGADLTMLQTLARDRSLESHVTFHGNKTRAELIRLLQQADVLAAPSVPTKDGRREGIPVALMEGMACGLPVVASRLSGIPELVNSERIGLLIPPKDVAGLADAFVKLADDPSLRKRMGQRARQRISESFALDANAAQLIKLFETRVECQRMARHTVS